MSAPVTLLQLQNRVLARADLQFASNSALVNGYTGELTDNINQGLQELYDLIVEVQDQDYYLNSVTFSTVSQTDTYAIGSGQAINISDFYRMRGLDITFGQNIVISAKPFMWSERNRYKWYSGWLYTQPVFYRLIGNALKLMPAPNGAFSLQMWYTPIFEPLLVFPTDTFDGIDGMEEYAVLCAAIKLLLKQEQFEHAQALMSERALVKDRVLGMLQNRDAENPERVQDTTRDDDFGMYPGF